LALKGASQSLRAKMGHGSSHCAKLQERILKKIQDYKVFTVYFKKKVLHQFYVKMPPSSLALNSSQIIQKKKKYSGNVVFGENRH